MESYENRLRKHTNFCLKKVCHFAKKIEDIKNFNIDQLEYKDEEEISLDKDEYDKSLDNEFKDR